MLATLSHLYAFELHQDGFHREYAFILPLRSHLHLLHVRILSQHTISRSVLKILPLSFLIWFLT